MELFIIAHGMKNLVVFSAFMLPTTQKSTVIDAELNAVGDIT